MMRGETNLQPYLAPKVYLGVGSFSSPVGAGAGKAQCRAKPSAWPARVLSSYARSAQDLRLFAADLAECGTAKPLEWEDALEAFPDGIIPSTSFELHGKPWRLVARSDGARVLHLAVPAAPDAAQARRPRLIAAVSAPQRCGGRRSGRVNELPGDEFKCDSADCDGWPRARARAAPFDSPREQGERQQAAAAAAAVAAAAAEPAGRRASNDGTATGDELDLACTAAAAASGGPPCRSAPASSAAPSAAADAAAVASRAARIYEQLLSSMSSMGSEGSGNGGGGGGGGGTPACLVLNSNTNAVNASPVLANRNEVAATADAKAANRGLGGAALAVTALAAALLARTLLGGRAARAADGPGGGSGGRRPRGRGTREMALTAALSACGDELRKAGRNESLLQDDWRLGRLRLAWPPAPVLPGYEPLSTQACEVAGVLRDLYGR